MLRPTAVVLLAGCLAACSSSPKGSAAGPSTSSEETFTTPPTEDPNPSTSTSSTTDEPPIVELPRLPIGGNPDVDSDNPALQCVHISWIVTTANNPIIPAGYAIEVTKATFNTKTFQVITGGCRSSQSSSPNCIGKVLRKGADRCDLGVKALPGADLNQTVRVGLAGILYCPKNVGIARCRQFASAVAEEPGVTIELELPPSPPPTSTTDSTTTATTTTTTATDTASGN